MKRILVLSALAALACNDEVTGLGPPSDPTTETFATSLGVNLSQFQQTPTGVFYRDLSIGTGAEVVAATDTVWVTYAVFLKDGKLVDSGNNSRFVPSGLIAGFRQGIVGMRVGGKRKLVVPSALAYGGESRRGQDGKILIPRQSTLVFDVELLRLHTPSDQTATITVR